MKLKPIDKIIASSLKSYDFFLKKKKEWIWGSQKFTSLCVHFHLDRHQAQTEAHFWAPAARYRSTLLKMARLTVRVWHACSPTMSVHFSNSFELLFLPSQLFVPETWLPQKCFFIYFKKIYFYFFSNYIHWNFHLLFFVLFFWNGTEVCYFGSKKFYLKNFLMQNLRKRREDIGNEVHCFSIWYR